MHDNRGIHKITHSAFVYQLKQGARINGKVVRAGSVVVDDNFYNSFSSGREIYVCENLPRYYKGNNPRLTVSIWTEGGYWERETLQNVVTRAIWAKFVENGRRKAKRDPLNLTDDQARDLMKHDRKKKGGGGGSRIYTSAINESLAFKQVTEEAYWANLNCASSGNASVVAANIHR